jgi:chemotaxis protein methyltransferase WspC
MSISIIKTLISQKIGIDFATMSERYIEKAIEQRCSACGSIDIKSYYQLLQTSPAELAELVEKIVVPETYFFRDPKSFSFLLNLVRTEWLSRPHNYVFRILSIPCSTGEEAYSIAIALMEAGLPSHRFQIDAIDISQVALTKAQQGIYGKNSFRGTDFIDRRRYFHQTSSGYEVSSNVRERVKFKQQNILDFSVLDGNIYDLIFCRNMLIYLNPSACESVFNTIHRLLTPTGLFLVASAETNKVPKDIFTAMRQSSTCTYKKNERRVVEIQKTISPAPELSSSQSSPINRAKYTEPRSPIREVNKPSIPSLESAKQLADEGKLDLAIDYCQQYLTTTPMNVEAYVLIAMLYQAKNNNDRAEKLFQKALYLDPHCQEALLYLALLKEHKGDAIGSLRLQQRIRN